MENTISRTGAALAILAIATGLSACNSSGARTGAAGSCGQATCTGGTGNGGDAGRGGAAGGSVGTGGATGTGGVGGGAGKGALGGTSASGGTGGASASGGVGGTGAVAGSGAGSGGSGGRGGSAGGSGSAPSSPCNGTCQLGTYCTGCGNGGTKKLACSCYMDTAGVGRWSCGGLGPCGSNGCGPTGDACDPHYETSCESCDGASARRSCTCVASGSGSQGTWTCGSSSGSCGVACGDHRCLPGEICINFGQYGGFPVDGGTGEPGLTPTCTAVPEACGGKSPSCAACIVSAYGCSQPGVCRDVGPQTFDCILGGA